MRRHRIRPRFGRAWQGRAPRQGCDVRQRARRGHGRRQVEQGRSRRQRALPVDSCHTER
jgi:hypothetical protein